MSKIWKSLTLLIVFVLYTYFPPLVSAANCTFTYNPSPPNQNMDKLIVTVKSNDLAADNYKLILHRPNNNMVTNSNLQFSPGPDGGVSTEFLKQAVGWQQGTHRLYFVRNDATLGGFQTWKDVALCSAEFSLAEISSQSSCKASILTKPIEPGTEVTLRVEGINKSTSNFTGTGGYDIIINGQFKQVYSTSFTSDTGNDDISLGEKFDVGTYLVQIKNRCGFLGTACSGPPRLQCNLIAFRVAPKGSGGGGEIVPSEVKLTRECKTLQDIKDGNYDPKVDSICTESKVEGCPDGGINTAIGCIRTSLAGFAQDILKFVIGIAGGLAFLMMLLGAFQMLTSAGNPETLQAGRERLTSAIIGLLFVIFAVLLLQIIGVGILNIPGFKP